MRLTRIYIDQVFGQGDTISLPDTAFRHLIRVLRLQEGDRFTAFNNRGLMEAKAIIGKIGKKTATATIKSVYKANRESPLKIALVQAISAADKMDFTIQKSVELGVGEIIPVYSARSQRRMKAAQIEKKMKHWQGIIVHATEQSGRTLLATIRHPVLLSDYLAQRSGNTPGIILDPTADQSIQELTLNSEQIEILVGPEGGFSPEEIAIMEDCSGIEKLRLGPRILRTETAGIVLMSCLQAQFGDFRS